MGRQTPKSYYLTFNTDRKGQLILFIEFETDCWECSKMHPMTASSPEELWGIVTGMGDWLPTIRIVAIENDQGDRIENPNVESDPILLPIIKTLREAQEGMKQNV